MISIDGFDNFSVKFREAWTNEHLHLIIMPTEKCNFRCIYCYENFNIGRMKRPVIEGIKAFLGRRTPSLSSLHIEWFGGEPTLAPDVVEEIMAHAQYLSKRYQFLLTGGMTTNAYRLTGESYKRFVDLSISRYQITLDGTRAVHNTTRVLASGLDTFDVIWSNLLAIKNIEADGEILLRLHLTAYNADDVSVLRSDISRTFGNDLRFKIDLQRIKYLGGQNDLSKLVLPSEKIGVEKNVSELDGNASMQSDIGYICYAAKPNSYIFRPDGRIGKCTVALYDVRNTVGTLNRDGSMDIDGGKMMPWLSGWVSGKPDVLACPAAALPKLG